MVHSRFAPPQATDWSVDQCKGLGDELRTSAEKHLGLVKKALDKQQHLVPSGGNFKTPAEYQASAQELVSLSGA